MTKITSVINSVISYLPTLTGFSTKTIIPNSYSVKDNKDIFLENGYGFQVNGSVVDDALFDHTTERRDFTFILTKKLYRLDSDSLPIYTTISEILEDELTLRQSFLGDNSIQVSNNIFNINFEGSSGVEFFKTDNFAYLKTETKFNFFINEKLN